MWERVHRTRFIRAMNLHALRLRVHMVIRRRERVTAPRAAMHLHGIAIFLVAAAAIGKKFRRRLQLVRHHLVADPHADADFLAVEALALADDLASRDHDGCALELLYREHAQRIAHDDRHAVRIRVAQPPQEDCVRRDAEICLRLAAARRKPQEIDRLSAVAFRMDERLDFAEEKRELERIPCDGARVYVFPARFQDLHALHQHRLVRETEGPPLGRIRFARSPERSDCLTHPCERRAAACEIFLANGMEGFRIRMKRLRLRCNPRFV